MDEGQNKNFYMTGDSIAAVSTFPFLETAQERLGMRRNN